jgi:hypothetical protein
MGSYDQGGGGEHVAFLDLQAMKRPGGHKGGGSNLSLTACSGKSSLSVICEV